MIPYGIHYLDESDIQAVVDALRSGSLTQGSRIAEFEQTVAEYVGARFAIAVSSGSAALHLAALAADIGPGIAAVTSPITFVATAVAPYYCNGEILFADIDPDTINVSPEAIDAVLHARPEAKVVIPVHYAGLPCNMERIGDIANRRGAVVIEDAAHAFGASYPNGRKVGCCEHSLMTIFSFHPVKIIATGEGGMITTNDEAIYRRLLRLRAHGITKGGEPFMREADAMTVGVANLWYYEMQEMGFNYRITDFQCALGLSQFKKVDQFIAWRRNLTERYDRMLVDQSLLRPAQSGGRDQSAHHLYPVRIDYGEAGISRAQLMLALREQDIRLQVHYIPVPAQPFFRERGFRPEDYPESLRYYEEALSLPLYYQLTEEQQQFALDTLLDLLG